MVANKPGYWAGRKRSAESKHKLSQTNKRKGIKPPLFKGKKHSAETKAKMSAWQKGKVRPRRENSNNWKGGITPLNLMIRHSIENKLWRTAVFERDNFMCQKYGVRGGRLHAHHLKNFSSYPELRFAIDNGITLSEKAHREFHHQYGIKNNTSKQMQEFLCQS